MTKAKAALVTRQLEILALRSGELAERVAVGQIGFLDAIDLAYSAAIWADLPDAIEASGLIETNLISGDDIVQATIAAAFAARINCKYDLYETAECAASGSGRS